MTQCKVLIVSQRYRPDGFGRQPGYVAFTEGEDVLADCTGAELHLVDHDLGELTLRTRRLAGRAVRRFGHVAPRLAGLSSTVPIPAGSTLGDHYDVAVFVGFTVWDLPLLEQLRGLRQVADRIVVWFPEAWASEFSDPRLRYEPFGLADHIFVGMKAAASELAAITPTPVHYLPPAVDVTRFTTAADDPRPIDVLGIGRRDARLHRALVEWSRKANKLYVYDTITGSQVQDLAAHRENLGDTYRRTNVAITNHAKYNMPSVIRNERELPVRVWEGLASGALMTGLSPDEELQTEQFGEPVVDEIPTDPAEAVEFIDELQRQPLTALRQARVTQALRGHDWAHRWAAVFRLAGLGVHPGIDARIEKLASWADAKDSAATRLTDLG